MSIISGLFQQRQSKIGWMVDAQLSLAPPSALTSSNSSLAGIYIKKRKGSGTGDQMTKASVEDSNCKKRKMDSEWQHDMHKSNCVNSSIGVELQMKSPLPLEWEQCLDLQSGRIYYVNRSTQLKTCQDPRHSNPNQFSKDLRLDLELNLPLKTQENEEKSSEPASSDINSAAEMVATVCAQCHMFVMFSKASRKCPNCKYVHPLMDQDKKDSNDISPARQTLSLIDCGPESKSKSKHDDKEEE